MKSTVFLSGVLLAWSVQAQVEVELRCPQKRFLPSESIPLSVRISNLTGAPLTLGQWPGWLNFSVEKVPSGVAKRIGDVSDSGSFTLEQSTVGTIKYDLSPIFEIDQMGTYRVTATVTPVDGGPSFTSAQWSFEVINGTRIEDRTFGFTQEDGSVEQRKYILQQANYLKQVQIYLRVTDSTESRTYKVVGLGGVVSFKRPEFLIDRKSQFHILHQYSATEYRYHVIDPDGVIVSREVRQSSDRRPQLRVNDEGVVAVIGGVRRLDKSDIPPPTEADWKAARDAEIAAAMAVARATEASATNAPSKSKKSK
jgi:hypothetical protein